MAGILTESERLRARENAENFPVALRLLPRNLRVALHAVYAVARVIDDTGDAAAGNRTAQLLDIRTDLTHIWRGTEPSHPVLRNLVESVRRYDLPEDPFQDLVEANLKDQTVTRYADFEELLGYCRLSANPVGRLVLTIFGQSTESSTAKSDDVCTALQLLEHWQDVGEDYRAGRIYLPKTDLVAHGVDEAALGGPTAGPELRGLMLFEIERAEQLLNRGAPLVRELTGWARFAIAGFVAGGRATAKALRAGGGEVLARQITPSRRDTAAAALALLAGSVRGARA